MNDIHPESCVKARGPGTGSGLQEIPTKLTNMITSEKQGRSTIYFEHGASPAGGRDGIEKLIQALPVTPSSLVIFTQEKIWVHHGDRLLEQLKIFSGPIQIHMFSDGESCKTLASYGNALEFMVSSGCDRRSAVLAFGGGTVGDCAGFVAASFMRGIPWIYIPTTLLAMQDASVGGKVAINLEHGKNLAGAFWAPEGVLISHHYLKTLPEREFKAGSMELIKHGILEGDPLFSQLQGLPEVFSENMEPWEHLLFCGVKTKIKVVNIDFKEEGLRKTLNLGHTLAHAVERVTGYQIMHGEAVGLGLIYCTCLSNHLGYGYDWNSLQQWILRRLPLEFIRLELEGNEKLAQILSLTSFDKKKEAGKLTWIIPRKPGDIVFNDDLKEPTLLSSLKAWKSLVGLA